MNAGDIVLTPLPQADGRLKPRPEVLLKMVPPFGDWLVCGVSTQLQQEVAGFDDIIDPSDPGFPGSGLKAPSLIRLGFLAVLPEDQLLGILGSISGERHRALMSRLSKFLVA
jgi:mRNA interferase MazF